jgi:sialic acid synthase SpsE
MSDIALRVENLSEAYRTSGCLVVGEVAQAHDGSLSMARAFTDAIRQGLPELTHIQTHTTGPGAGGSSQ